jgi:hypothetical protein
MNSAQSTLREKDLCKFMVDRMHSRYSDWLWAGWLRGPSSSPTRIKNFLISKSSKPALGSTQPPISSVPGVKRPMREADHLPPAYAEVKKMWIYISTLPYAFIA